MPIDYSVLASVGGIGKGTPRGLRAHSRKAAEKAKLAKAYAEVDARDQGYCVVTGAYTTPGAIDPKKRREHHHLSGRRVRPSWKFDSRRIITVSAFAHSLLTSEALQLEGDDATKRIVAHWNRRLVKPGKEPFQLRSKRWSANENE